MNSELMDNVSLQVIMNGEVVFQSDGHWLYPLFDFLDYLKAHPINMSETEVHDKIVGKAAAMLLIQLRPGSIQGNVMSELAVDVFKNAGTPYAFKHLVKRIDCQTEEILLDVKDPQVAYGILCQRAKRC